MQICPDPLEAVRSVGPNQQWCVTLPACYPTIIPYIPTNVEYNGQKTSNTTSSNFDVNNYDCKNIIDSSLCSNNQLIQRLRHKIDLYQTPSSNDARQILRRLTNIVKQHVPDFVFNEIVDGNVRKRANQSNVQQDVLPTSSSVTSKSRSPPLLQRVIDRKITDEHVLLTNSSRHSRLSNSSLHSTNLSTHSIQTNEGSSQFLPTQSLQSLPKLNEDNFKKIDSESSEMFDSRSSDHNDQASVVMSIPVPSTFSTPRFSKQQIASNQLRQAVKNMMTTSSPHGNSTMTVSTPNVSNHHLDGDDITSSIVLKSSSFLLPSPNQQRLDRISSAKQTTSAVQLPTGSASDFGQEELLTQSSTSTYLSRSPTVKSQYSNQVRHTLLKSDENIDRNRRNNHYQHRSSKVIRNDKVGKRNSWIEKLMKKVSSKYLNTTSFHNSSPENISHMYINDQNRIDRDHLHMREAMAALELDLTKEAFHALINKRKDSQQNRLMRILTTPSRCCRSCRTQRRLATVAQRSIDIAIKNYTDISNK